MGVDIKTTDLTNKSAPVGPDLFMIVDSEDTTMAPSGTNKKALFTDVARAIASLLGLGTAATKAASGAGPDVASVAGPITPGHAAIFADAAGTIADGGPAGGAPAAEPANTVHAGPAGGGPALPGFRLLTVPDIPMIPESGVANLVGDLAAIDAALATLCKTRPSCTRRPTCPTWRPWRPPGAISGWGRRRRRRRRPAALAWRPWPVPWRSATRRFFRTWPARSPMAARRRAPRSRNPPTLSLPARGRARRPCRIIAP